MAETLTVVREGGCLTSILNMNDEEISLSLPIVNLEECEIETNTIQVDTFVAQGAVTREDRLRVTEENSDRSLKRPGKESYYEYM